MKNFDIIVIGAGHAGAEAGLAGARLGFSTLVITVDLDNIAFLACNPSIGGTAKGQLAAEVDALGGEMGKVADYASIQSRLLNESKGPAVQSLRVQVDKNKYHTKMKQVLENEPNLFLKQGEAVKILTKTENGKTKACGIKLATGEEFLARAVIVATGVYLKSTIIMGEYTKDTGPNGFAAANELTSSLVKIGHEVRRFKTGTPARVNSRSINYKGLEEQVGDDNAPRFSSLTECAPTNTISCHLTYTNLKTHQIIKENIHLAPMYSGQIKGIGPRYCPSIEDKVTRFEERERHQLFLEPETENAGEVYIQGLSTSFGCDIQNKIIRSVKGLENAEIMRNAYAIEYDAIDCLTLKSSLESKLVENLFFAGQVNGTSGYEEAAGQGLIAGINAAQKLKGNLPLILKRSDAYIGVLIDDLVTKGTAEPYRMMTSRAEYRLLLRQDNADIRLTEKAIKIGLASDERIKKYNEKLAGLESARLAFKKAVSLKVASEILKKYGESTFEGMSAERLSRRKGVVASDFYKLDAFNGIKKSYIDYVFSECKYEGYIKRELEEVARAKKEEEMLLPQTIDYLSIKGLKVEAAKKLNQFKPSSLGEASRISGVSPADILVLTIYLKLQNKK